MEDTYKFYFSLENSVCKDYISEKFFNILKYNVIPVVLNGANMSSIAPPHSFINVQDFSSTKHLVEYLEEINKNDTLFASYFWWKEHYFQTHPAKESWCELCKLLHDEKNHQEPPDILKNSDMSQNCKSPPF